MRKKLIRTKEAAEMLGVSSKTIKRMNFEQIKVNPAPNSPIFVFKAEVERYKENLRRN